MEKMYNYTRFILAKLMKILIDLKIHDDGNINSRHLKIKLIFYKGHVWSLMLLYLRRERKV